MENEDFEGPLVDQRGDAFRSDNVRVWNELQSIMADTPAWTWISKYEGKKDGRAAMKELVVHQQEY
jgi:hypothetical protein